MRLFFALTVSALDVDAYSALNAHNSFIQLYAYWAMVLPDGIMRITMLKIVLVHQVMSPGVSKLRVGGRKWFSAETIAAYLSASGYPLRPRPWAYLNRVLYQPWLVTYVISKKEILGSFLSLATVLLQVAVVPFCVCISALHVYALFFVTLFVMGVAILFGLNFCFHISAFWLLLVLDSCDSHSTSPNISQPKPTDDSSVGFGWEVFGLPVVVAAALFYSTAVHLESWPLNAQGLYSYNHEQLARFLSLKGRFVLHHQEDDLRVDHKKGMVKPLLVNGRRCLVAATASGIPVASIYHHVFAQQVGGVVFGLEETPTDEVCVQRLESWIRREQPYLDPDREFKPFDTVEYKHNNMNNINNTVEYKESVESTITL